MVYSQAPGEVTESVPLQLSFRCGVIGVSRQIFDPTCRHFNMTVISSWPSLKTSALTVIVSPTARLTANRALSSEGEMRRMTVVSGLLFMARFSIFAGAVRAHQAPTQPPEVILWQPEYGREKKCGLFGVRGIHRRQGPA